MIRAVVLDLGNVLLFHDNARLFRNLAERAGRGAEAESLGRALVQHPLWNQANRGELQPAAIREAVCGLLGMQLQDDEFDALWSSHFTPNDDVFPIVEALQGRVKRALLSNTNALHVAWFLPRLPLLSRFDATVLSCEVGRVKPEPAIYEETLRRLQVSPAEAVFFDDIPEYVDAAHAVGMKGFVFRDVPGFVRDLASLGL